MDCLNGGAQAPGVKLRAVSRPVTSHSASTIVMRTVADAGIDPDFDDDNYTRSAAGDTLYCMGVAA